MHSIAIGRETRPSGGHYCAIAREFTRVMLVNHGPVGDVLGRVSAAVRERCQAVGNLTPMMPAVREKLRSAVLRVTLLNIEPAI